MTLIEEEVGVWGRDPHTGFTEWLPRPVDRSHALHHLKTRAELRRSDLS